MPPKKDAAKYSPRVRAYYFISSLSHIHPSTTTNTLLPLHPPPPHIRNPHNGHIHNRHPTSNSPINNLASPSISSEFQAQTTIDDAEENEDATVPLMDIAEDTFSVRALIDAVVPET